MFRLSIKRCGIIMPDTNKNFNTNTNYYTNRHANNRTSPNEYTYYNAKSIYNATKYTYTFSNTSSLLRLLVVFGNIRKGIRNLDRLLWKY